MIGTIVNTATVLAGSSIGCMLKKGIPEKYTNIFFQIVGLFTLVLGMQMALGMQSPLLVVFSLIIGGFLGEWWNLEGKFESLSDKLKSKFKLRNEKFTEGFMTGFLLFCMGSMSILGAIEEGFGKTSDLLLMKALMDGFSSMMLASALGVGVVFSALGVFAFQGGITALVMLFGKEIPVEIITDLTAVGGIILLGLALNLLKLKQIKVSNFLPSLFFICLFVWLKLNFIPLLEGIKGFFPF